MKGAESMVQHCTKGQSLRYDTWHSPTNNAPTMTNTLEQHLLGYDGKATSTLSQIRKSCKENPAYFEELAVLCVDDREKISNAATWLLKAELENGTVIPQSVIDKILKTLENIHSWQAVLHLCQSVEHFNLTLDQLEQLLDWVKPYTKHPRPFLRAWGFHAIIVLSLRHPTHAHQIPSVLKAAEEDMAASVRARARNLRKKLAVTKYGDK